VAIEIHPYRQAAAAYGDYDADVVDAALALADGICLQDSRLRVEHIGSTAVPGCGGKGYIDLLLMYPDGHLDAAKAALETLGFRRQSSRDPFPEDRPMLLRGQVLVPAQGLARRAARTDPLHPCAVHVEHDALRPRRWRVPEHTVSGHL